MHRLNPEITSNSTPRPTSLNRYDVSVLRMFPMFPMSLKSLYAT
jgi:hypothetical protein